MGKKKDEPVILVHDWETSLLQFFAFQTGKQVLTHKQLVDPAEHTKLICGSWGFVHEPTSKIKTVGYGFRKQDSTKPLKAFLKDLKKADIVVGKNNRMFDDKHIRTIALLHDIPLDASTLHLLDNSDDLETVVRKNFYLPSNSLDYILKALKIKNKSKMEFNDWVKIYLKQDIKAYNKMMKYCANDVAGTINAFKKISPYVTWRNKAHKIKQVKKLQRGRPKKYDYSHLSCNKCGSSNIHIHDTRAQASTVYKLFMCKDGNHYAGKASVNINTHKLGKNMT